MSYSLRIFVYVYRIERVLWRFLLNFSAKSFSTCVRFFIATNIVNSNYYQRDKNGNHECSQTINCLDIKWHGLHQIKKIHCRTKILRVQSQMIAFFYKILYQPCSSSHLHICCISFYDVQITWKIRQLTLCICSLDSTIFFELCQIDCSSSQIILL